MILQQLILTYAGGSYVYYTSSPDLMQSRFRGLLDGVTVRNQGFLQFKDGDDIILVYSEAVVAEDTSRGFIHRHGIILNQSDYERLSANPEVLDHWFLTYKDFTRSDVRNLQPLTLPESYHPSFLEYEDLAVLSKYLTEDEIRSTLYALANQAGKTTLYCDADYATLRKIAFAALQLLPIEIRSGATVNVNTVLRYKESPQLAIYEGSARPRLSVPTIEVKLLEDLTTVAFRIKDPSKARSRWSEIVGRYYESYSRLARLSPKSEAAIQAMRSYEASSRQAEALYRTLQSKLDAISSRIGEADPILLEKELGTLSDDAQNYHLGPELEGRIEQLTARLKETTIRQSLQESNKAKWKRLPRDLAKLLQEFEADRLSFRNEFQAIKGLPTDSFRSDGMLTDGRVLLAVEVESSQSHPDTNVGKYWYLYTKHQYEKIVLFHIYTPLFDSYASRKDLAKFYESKMKKDSIPIRIETIELTDDAEYETTLSNLKSRIADSIRSNFG